MCKYSIGKIKDKTTGAIKGHYIYVDAITPDFNTRTISLNADKIKAAIDDHGATTIGVNLFHAPNSKGHRRLYKSVSIKLRDLKTEDYPTLRDRVVVDGQSRRLIIPLDLVRDWPDGQKAIIAKINKAANLMAASKYENDQSFDIRSQSNQ